jgi:hypothetical protein
MKPQAATILAGSLHGNFKNFSAVKWANKLTVISFTDMLTENVY